MNAPIIKIIAVTILCAIIAALWGLILEIDKLKRAHARLADQIGCLEQDVKDLTR